MLLILVWGFLELAVVLVLAMLLALDLDVTTFFLRRTRTTSTSNPPINVSSRAVDTWGNKSTRSPCSDTISDSTPIKAPAPDLDVGGVIASSLEAFPESSGDIPGESDGGGVPALLDDRMAETTGNAGFAGSGKGRPIDAGADADGWVCGDN